MQKQMKSVRSVRGRCETSVGPWFCDSVQTCVELSAYESLLLINKLLFWSVHSFSLSLFLLRVCYTSLGHTRSCSLCPSHCLVLKSRPNKQTPNSKLIKKFPSETEETFIAFPLHITRLNCSPPPNSFAADFVLFFVRFFRFGFLCCSQITDCLLNW